MIRLEKLQGKTICVAVSGGVDSVCLLHYLNERKKEYGYSVCAVNFEHGLRGEESVEDSRFVADLCNKWQVPLYTFSADCNQKSIEEKTGLEETARNFRMEVYARLIAEKKADLIATAHHADDNAETILFRLMRGASLSGVRGIEEQTSFFIRPFHEKTKEELYQYAKKHGLSYRVDKTNFEPITARNRIRLEVLPVLEQCVPGAKKNLLRFASLAAEDDAFLYRLSEQYVQKGTPKVAGDSGWFVRFCEEKPLFYRAALTVLKALGMETDYTFARLEELYRLQFLQTGTKASVCEWLYAEKEYECIRFYKVVEQSAEEEIEFPFALGEYRVGGYRVVVQLKDENALKTHENAWGRELTADFDKFPKTAKIRLKKEGDRFEKFGGGEKTLKKYLTDKKIPSRERAVIPVIAEGSEVYAVFGVEISERVRVVNGAARVCVLTLIKE
ncbi:MAG: tRNA lysidine(34) synthetase TilS [Clostridia bacterium]|nr:tRNA lysidine(34) synthetase TilS [Clostridia bacterium]